MMPFENIVFLDLTIKGMLIGIVASAPMGPVGILCVQRTLNKGRWYGFATGVGAAISDIIYAIITGFGLSFAVDFIKEETTMFWCKLIGSIILFIFGVWTFRCRPQLQNKGSHHRGTLWHNGLTGFLVTVSNPLIIALFLAMFAQFTFVVPDHFGQQLLGYFSILLGALMWWWLLTYIIDKVRASFDPGRIWIINRIIGTVVMVVSFLVFLSTMLGLVGIVLI